MGDQAALEALYNPIKNEVILAHAEFQLWDELYATHPERVEILNKTAGGFFEMLSPLLADNLIMRLSRLTDPPTSGKYRNLTLYDLLPTLEQPDAASNYREKLQTLHDVCDPMRVQRNKRLAHLDFHTAVARHPDDLPRVRVSVIRHALVVLKDALNVFERSQQLPTVMYADFIFQSGPRALLAALKRSIAYSEHVAAGRIDPRDDKLELPQREGG